MRVLFCDSESSATNILQRLLQQLSSSDTSLAKTAARQASRFFYYCSGTSIFMRPELWFSFSYIMSMSSFCCTIKRLANRPRNAIGLLIFKRDYILVVAEFQETILVEMLQMGRFASDDLQQLLQGLFTVSGGPLQ